ncbi:MAG TPA: FKBP-type peptidyl-prolyl cis-trans isomerase, partial [Thermoanaerobaculia bacterium]|nr:FKBP-type peptidyl-prolyl cis-trans isomerase [Thermoanaerobaculia bacterium]
MNDRLHRGALALLLAALAPVTFGQDEQPPAQPPTETAPQAQTEAAPEAEAAPTAEEAQETASYALGFQIGSNFAGQGIEIDLEAFISGLRTATAGGAAAFTPEQMQAAMQRFQADVTAAQQQRMAQQGASNLAAGQAFLTENAARAGVRVLDSGLQIEMLTEGTGDTPTLEDRVVVHYTGTLPDGTVFDSSRDRGQPATFPLTGVIAGFAEGIQQLKEGGRAKLYIPPALGYGEQGVGPIPPNATLVFDIELIDVLDAEAAPAPP